jgi:O-antigen ligase
MAVSPVGQTSTFSALQRKLDIVLFAGMEGLVLAMVVLSPWAYGSVDPEWEFWLYVGLVLLLGLWAIRLLKQFHLPWKNCPIAFCLLGLVLLAGWQIAPLPHSLLSVLSPTTRQLYDRVLPAEPEQLPDPFTRPDVSAGSTISFYTYGTRVELGHLLTILLVYLLVRNTWASQASLWRLSIASVAVGAALALFALVQFFTSPPNLIYWHTQTTGIVFGPFVCRNHFPCYLNLCFGLGIGLLCNRILAKNAGSSGVDFRFFDMLQQPGVLWLSILLILMATSIVFSASRGGLLAFLGGSAVCLTLVFLRPSGFVPLKASLLIAVASLALLTWFGLERVQARFGVLLQGQAGNEDRVRLLSRAPAMIKDYPIWGTGFGSLDFVEPIYRTDAADAGWDYQHAHNEYLEALLEGGLVRLVLTLLIIGLVFRRAFRAFRLLEGSPGAGLVLGVLFGFTTLVLHSVVDFGIHIPAIALLATVLCAHLVALSEPKEIVQSTVEVQAVGTRNGLPLLARGFAALLGVAALVGLGWYLLAEAYRAALVQTLLQAALTPPSSTNPVAQLKRIAILEDAARLDPNNARLHFEIGEQQAFLFGSLKQKQLDQEAFLDATQAVLLLNPGCSIGAGASGPTSLLFAVTIHQERRKRTVKELGRRHIVPGLRHYLLARDLCPARAKTHMEIAAHVEFLTKAEPRRNYLERALYLDPTHPELWYRAGVLEAYDGQRDQAYRDWQHSLELSDVCLKRILDRSIGRVDSKTLIDQILPDRPSVLVASAAYLYPNTDAPQRRPFYEKARILFNTLPGPWPADDLRLKGLVLNSLGHTKESLTAYKEALSMKPLQLEWRLEFARLLLEQEQFQEARQELGAILSVQPRHGAARDLLARLERESKRR